MNHLLYSIDEWLEDDKKLKDEQRTHISKKEIKITKQKRKRHASKRTVK
jgi:hypothetical protein